MANAAAAKTATSSTPQDHPSAREGDSAPGFVFAMLTHPGRTRHSNQDACAAAPEHAAFVVCDGVGGAAGGEIASRLAANSFLAALSGSGLDSPPANEAGGPHARLHHAIAAANAAVFERAQRSRNLRGMATTLVAALLEHPSSLEDGRAANPAACPTLWLAHAGDSRAYRLRRTASLAQITQLTADHSLVEEQIRAGILQPAEAANSPIRNVITRAVGSMPSVEPEIASHAIEPGDIYLLASDGLTRELPDAEIARIAVGALVPAAPSNGSTQASHVSPPSSASLEAAAQALVEAANRHGGRDNITVLLIACR